MTVQNPEILWPSLKDSYVRDIPEYIDVHGILDMAMALIDPTSEFGEPSNVLLNGHFGLGKSLLAANIVKRLERQLDKQIPVVTFDCSEDTFELVLTGSSRIVAGGTTPFIPGPFPTAIHLANQAGICVFCVDEISALTPGAQKVFNRLTDWRQGMYIPDISRNVRLNEGCRVIIVATMNPSGFGGVYTLNADLDSRFDPVIVPFPTQEQETKILASLCPWASNAVIESAIRLAAESRTKATDYSLSTRDLVKLLKNYYRLQAKTDGAKFALTIVANRFEGSQRDTMCDRIEATFAGVTIDRMSM